MKHLRSAQQRAHQVMRLGEQRHFYANQAKIRSLRATNGGGGFKPGGGSRSGLVLPFLSFCLLGLSRFFRDFPDLFGDGPGIFPMCPFPLSRPINSAYEEQSRTGPRHNPDLSRRQGTPPVWKPPGLETPKKCATFV